MVEDFYAVMSLWHGKWQGAWILQASAACSDKGILALV